MRTVSTEGVRPSERLSFWQEMVSSRLMHVDCQSIAGFSGSLRFGASGPISFAEVKASPHIADRGMRYVAEDDDCSMFFLQLKGAMGVVVKESEYAVPPGSLFFYDMNSPIHLRFTDDFRHLVFRVPQHFSLDLATPHSSTLFVSHSPMLSVAAAASAALFESVDDPTARFDIAIRAVVSMLAETIGEMLPLSDASPAERALTVRFECLLDERLHDNGLAAEHLARELGVTPQYLNRVLARSGGSMSKRILTRRLQRCANDLRSLRSVRSVRVSDIAFRWGFNDLSYFSRSFRAFYGMSPSDYRMIYNGGTLLR